jgi:flagellar biosynthesis protein
VGWTILPDGKKRKKAAALQYFDTDNAAPVITALGDGQMAEMIIKQARLNGIEVMENPDFFMFENLFVAGGEIPPEVYKIVVDILQYILHTNTEG